MSTSNTTTITKENGVKKIRDSISLQASFTAALMLMTLLALALSILTTSFYSRQKALEESIRFTKSISDIIIYNAQIPLTFNQRQSLDGFLTTLKDIKSITNVHVYRRDENNELKFFSTYNHTGEPPIPPQIGRVHQLIRPTFTDNILEYAAPIVETDTSENLGFLYIRVTTDHNQETLVELFTYNGPAILALIVIAVILSFLMRRLVLNPLNRFVQDIQNITNDKDFTVRIDGTPVAEMSALVNSINTLLAKIQQQINRFAEAETEIRELNQSLEEKVASRTQALRDSNTELLEALEQVHQYQSQVIESEKMASLGQMVAGVAHEVNTPIGLGVTASTMLSDNIDDVQKALDDKSLTSKKLTKFLADAKENTQIIYRNLSRAADLISSFKQVAVDQTADSSRNVNLNELLHEVITSLHPTLKKYQHNVVLDCDESLNIRTKPGPINQILINLIMNSLIHAFRDDEAGIINIKVWRERNQCLIEFRDNGRGIEEKVKQKIFDPFVTTRRGEGGSGLGMHLVYNLVTQALKGHIVVTSQLGQGAQFDISFPIEGEI